MHFIEVNRRLFVKNKTSCRVIQSQWGTWSRILTELKPSGKE